MKTFIPFLPRGLGAQLALAFSILSIILTAALVVLVERRAITQLKEHIGIGLADLAAQTSDKLERGMFERYREVALMAAQLPQSDPRRDAAGLGRKLAQVQRSYTYYEWLGLADLDGRVLASGNNLLIDANVAARPWYKGGLRGGFVGDVHEALLLEKLLPRQNEPRRFVDVAFPYADASGKVQGVLGAHLSWSWAREVEESVLGAAERHGKVEALILNSAGRVLLGPRELMDKTLALESVRQALPTRQGGFLVERWPDGKEYLVGFQKGTGYADYPGLGWIVLVRQELGDAYAPVRDVRRHAAWSGIGLALLFSLFGVWVARRITHPLRQLANSASELKPGAPVRLRTRADGYEEVAALRHSLNALVDDLESRRSQLQQLNGSLEQVVEARTHELRSALETVQVSEMRIRAIVETAQDAFIGAGLDGHIKEWNKQAEQLLGWRRDEVIGKTLHEVVGQKHYRPGELESLLSFLQTGKEGALDRRVERIVTDRYGVEIPVEISTGLTGRDETAMFSLFLRDITERKRIDQMKTEFVGTVSHELRTPLASIRASLALLADGVLGTLPPDVLELIQICNNNCVRLNRLVDDMLDIQKIEAGMMTFAPKEQPLQPLAREAIRTMRSMATSAGVALVLDGADDVMAEVDHDRILQVLINLLSNAIKVAPDGSAVLVQVLATPEGARISVCDRGPGIPMGLRERVFQPFVQLGRKDSATGASGTGLGLAICKRIVEEHGGTISITDAPGGGTIFNIMLARSIAPRQAA